MRRGSRPVRRGHLCGRAARRPPGGPHPFGRRGGTRGYSVAELLIVLALVALAVVPALPGGAFARKRAALAGAATYVAQALNAARTEAVRRGANVAVQFGDNPQQPAYRLVVDGNGDGVRRADVEAGIDRPLGGMAPLADHFPGVRFLVGCRCPDIDATTALRQGAPGVRFGPGALAVFTPAGTATSGTVYISAGDQTTYAVRVLGATGRLRTLRFDEGIGEWVAP